MNTWGIIYNSTQIFVDAMCTSFHNAIGVHLTEGGLKNRQLYGAFYRSCKAPKTKFHGSDVTKVPLFYARIPEPNLVTKADLSTGTLVCRLPWDPKGICYDFIPLRVPTDVVATANLPLSLS